MKFMKLGSRPDTFFTTEAVRSVSSEVSSDLIVQVKGNKYLLHKFPLLSKCLLLQTLCSESPESSHVQLIKLPNFPASGEAFELCAKFCYGITITLSAYNIVSIRCAAEYLQMTEDADKGNLIDKVEVFITSCILQGWRDTVVTLQSTKAFPISSEDLGITSRCIESITSKVSAHPMKVGFSQSCSRRGRDDESSNGSERHRDRDRPNKGWWGEELADIGIDLYWRTMVGIKSSGRVPSCLIGDALSIYVSRWLPNVSNCMPMEENGVGDDNSKHRLFLESIVSLLPAEKGAVSCSFLLKLLKAANILKASSSCKTELARRAAHQLEEATVVELLVPCLSSTNGTMYDVDVFMTILEFMVQGQCPQTSSPRKDACLERRGSRSAEDVDLEFVERRRSSSVSHSAKLKIAKLVDGYLQEIAKDENLPLSKFIAVAVAIPDFARVDHHDLYRAIDVYLKGHPELNKSERKRICQVLDCKKLSVEACTHAAQNERLPLRLIVQVLFIEQARATMAGGQVTELPSNIKVLLNGRKTPSRTAASFSISATMARQDKWSVSGQQSQEFNHLSTLKTKLAVDDELDDDLGVQIEKSSKPSRSKRIFCKFWSISRSASDKN